MFQFNIQHNYVNLGNVISMKNKFTYSIIAYYNIGTSSLNSYIYFLWRNNKFLFSLFTHLSKVLVHKI
jgi:hypothetical protein